MNILLIIFLSIIGLIGVAFLLKFLIMKHLEKISKGTPVFNEEYWKNKKQKR